MVELTMAHPPENQAAKLEKEMADHMRSCYHFHSWNYSS